MTSLWMNVVNTYTHAVHSSADTRTKEWLLVNSPWIPLLVTCCYVYLCVNVRQITAKMPVYKLKTPIVCYNALMVAISLYMTYEFVVTAYLARYNWLCQPVDVSTSYLGIRMASVCWVYYFSKYIEMIETVMFAFRKKYNQISVLHVYHHTSMVWMWWLMIKYAPGGQSSIFGGINSFVHVVMYTYYGLSALGPRVQKYLWWKKYITMFQLSQFVILFFYCIQNAATDCNFPKWLCVINVGYATSLLFLFLNFYVHAYMSKKASGPQIENKIVTNGHNKHK